MRFPRIRPANTAYARAANLRIFNMALISTVAEITLT